MTGSMEKSSMVLAAPLGQCYMLSWGGLDPEFGFGFGVPKDGVWMDWASASGSLCQLCFRIQYLTMGSGHVARHDGEASNWIRGTAVAWRASTMEFYSSDV